MQGVLLILSSILTSRSFVGFALRVSCGRVLVVFLFGWVGMCVVDSPEFSGKVILFTRPACGGTFFALRESYACVGVCVVLPSVYSDEGILFGGTRRGLRHQTATKADDLTRLH